MGRPSKEPARIPINERSLLTRKMAAAYLSISESRLDEYRAAGDVKVVELGTRNIRYRRRELENLIDKIEQKQTHFDRMTTAG